MLIYIEAVFNIVNNAVESIFSDACLLFLLIFWIPSILLRCRGLNARDKVFVHLVAILAAICNIVK